MKYILTESQFRKLISEVSYDPKVEKIQKDLVSKGYDLGNYGPNGDGVDGKMGPLTKSAYEKEYGKKLSSEKVTSDFGGSNYDAMLVGGLDYRSGDFDINTQVEFLKIGIGSNKKVKGFRYNTPISTIDSFLEKNSKIPIFLFSAGCSKAEELSTNPNVNKNKLYIIEPYAKSLRTKRIVQSAVSNGVPKGNVFVGDTKARGFGVVNGATSSNSPSHWGALKKIGFLVNL